MGIIYIFWSKTILLVSPNKKSLNLASIAHFEHSHAWARTTIRTKGEQLLALEDQQLESEKQQPLHGTRTLDQRNNYGLTAIREMIENNLVQKEVTE